MEMQSTHSLGNFVFSNSLIISTIFPYLSVGDQIQFSKTNTTTKQVFLCFFPSQDGCRFDSYNDVKNYMKLDPKLLCHTKFIFHSSINLAAGLNMKPDPIITNITRFNNSRFYELVSPVYSPKEGKVMEMFLSNCALSTTSLKGFLAWRKQSEFKELVHKFRNVRNLELDVDRGSNTTFDLFPWAIRAERCENIERDWHLYDITGRSVKRLKVGFRLSKKDEEDDAINLFVRFILHTFPNVEHLQVCPWKEEIIKHVESYCTRKIIELKTSGRLSHLGGVICMASESKFPDFESTVLERPLPDLSYRMKENEIMTALLKRPSLSNIYELHLNVRIDHKKLERDEDNNAIVPLYLPALPNLKHLHLGFPPSPKMNIKYRIMFPKLGSLNTDATPDHENPSLFEAKEDYVFLYPTDLKKEAICGLIQHSSDQNSVFESFEKEAELMARILQMFPNVLRFTWNDKILINRPFFCTTLNCITQI